MKKHKICKILLVILAIFLCVAFYELLGICVAYKKQPEVSNTTKKETKNGSWNECSENTERAVIIEKNPEALLQRVRLIKNAKNRVKIHTPYIICNDMMYNTWEEIAENVSDFSIMTNSVANNGNPFGAADYAKNRNRILSTGINIWEYEGGTIVAQWCCRWILYLMFLMSLRPRLMPLKGIQCFFREKNCLRSKRNM